MGSRLCWQAIWRYFVPVCRGVSLFALAWLLGSGTAAKAQTYLENVGVPAFTTKLPVENGFINAANGNLHLEIPLGFFPQRAGAPDKIVLMYDSAIWFPLDDRGWEPINIADTYGNPSWGGWRIVTSRDPGFLSNGETDSGYCAATDDYSWATYSPWIWTAPDGTQRSFSAPTTAPIYPTYCPGAGTPNGGGYASDGSGYYISITNYTQATVYAPDGTKIGSCDPPLGSCSSSPYASEDANGNYVPAVSYSNPNNILTTTYVDTLGRAILTGQNTSPNVWTFAVPNAQGTNSTYTVTLETINVDTNFGPSGFPGYYGTITVISEIDLPDLTKYVFGYDYGTTLQHTGQLSSMTLPTGGQISYSYSVFSDADHNPYPWVSGRTTPDGSWTYSNQIVGSGCPLGYSGYVDCEQQFTVTKPSTDQTVYTFALNGGAWPVAVQYNDHVTGNLATTTQCFSFVAVNTNGGCSYSVTQAPTATDVHLLATTTTLPAAGGSNVSTTTEYSWDSGNQGTYGELTQISEWNFGSSPANAADRTTYISYLDGTSYINANILNRPQQITVAGPSGNAQSTWYSYDQFALGSATGMAGHDDANYGTGNTVRGNVTGFYRLISGSTWLNDTFTHFDMTGQPISLTDSNNNTTTLAYSSSYQNAYPTTITNALTQSTLLGYDFNTGLLTSTTDPNSQTTSSSYDEMGRPLTTNYPDGGQTTLAYNYSGTVYTGVTATTKIASSVSPLVITRNVDGLGREISDVLVSDQDSGGHPTVTATYDSDGRVHTVSNPYRSTSDYIYGYQTFAYDGLDRVSQITEQDTSVKATYYGAAVTSGGGATSSLCSAHGYPVLTVDEAGKKRQTWTDGFGRTIETDEPDSSNNLTLGSCNSYDANDNLIQVVQGNENRSYLYDMLSRLTAKTEPETGLTSFYYTTSGGSPCSGDPSAVCQRTRPAPNQVNPATTVKTTYYYDALNRLTNIVYSDGTTPSVYRAYDLSSDWGSTVNGIGRLSEETTYLGSTTYTASAFWNFDPMGRPQAYGQCPVINCGTAYVLSYGYDYLGDVTSYSNGAGVTFSQTPDSAGRISALTSNWVDSQHPANLATVDPSLGYWPNGALHVMTLGNGLTETVGIDPRLNPCRINLNSSSTFLATCADATPNGNVQDYGYAFGTWGSSYNGNVSNWWGAGTQGFNRTYTYDNLNRLGSYSSPSDPSGCYGLSWNYDRWGNRTDQNYTSGTCGTSHLTYNTSNQITSTGYEYDAAGNLIDGGYFSYDAENRVVAVNGGATASYTYDADGRRVQKVAGGATTNYVQDLSGNILAETQGGTLTKGYAYLNGQLIAQYDNGTTHFLQTDHLGSARVLTGVNGCVAESLDYLPFGELNSNGSATCPADTTQKFTGYERDSETGADYALARYYGSGMGRFFSPDPLGGDITDPQTLNRYAYVRNSPLTLTDPTGMDAEGCGDDPTCGGCDFCIGIGIGIGGDGGGEGPDHPPYTPPGVTNSPNPPNGTLASDDPFGGETFADGSDSPFDDPLGGLLPSGLGCDLSACGFRRVRSHPQPQLFPGLTYAAFLFRIFVDRSKGHSNAGETVKAVRTMYGDRTPEIPEFFGCMASKALPIGLGTGASYLTDKLIEQILERIGMEGVKKAGPIGTLGTVVGAAIGCSKEIRTQ